MFGGTSGASAMTAAASVLIQSAYKAANGTVLSSQQVRTALLASGTARQSGATGNPATQNIGPRPDAAIAILDEVGGCMPLRDTGIGDPAAGGGTNGLVSAITVFDDGGGEALYAGGSFQVLYDLPAANIARWDGCPVCSADVDGNGVVDVLDLLAVLASWGSTGGPADINGDGVVNVLDLLQVLAAWGPCP